MCLVCQRPFPNAGPTQGRIYLNMHALHLDAVLGDGMERADVAFIHRLAKSFCSGADVLPK